MNSAHASAMAGYVVPTWYGRNGWGGLKYWLTTPGRYSLAEAFYLNQQDMLHQIDSWDPELCRKPFPYGPEGFAEEDLAKAPKWQDTNLRSMSWASSSTATCWPSTATRHGTSG